MAFFDTFSVALKQKWLDYYQANRSWLLLHMTADNTVATPDGGKRPVSYLILGIAAALEPELQQLMLPFSRLKPDADSLIEVLGLNFDPDMALGMSSHTSAPAAAQTATAAAPAAAQTATAAAPAAAQTATAAAPADAKSNKLGGVALAAAAGVAGVAGVAGLAAAANALSSQEESFEEFEEEADSDFDLGDDAEEADSDFDLGDDAEEAVSDFDLGDDAEEADSDFDLGDD
ncbi:DUF5331 domain-containing protein, partial [Microcoleus sp. herbarium19]|uniref:DUF5331 domain-containing protein n=1 Tax=Microcoleus sp. herbarium19 TaxID=3055440 RepID=UPI002FCFE797